MAKIPRVAVSVRVRPAPPSSTPDEPRCDRKPTRLRTELLRNSIRSNVVVSTNTLPTDNSTDPAKHALDPVFELRQ
jgi:hypothetical protein